VIVLLAVVTGVLRYTQVQLVYGLIFDAVYTYSVVVANKPILVLR
jgi:hypothetical protein